MSIINCKKYGSRLFFRILGLMLIVLACGCSAVGPPRSSPACPVTEGDAAAGLAWHPGRQLWGCPDGKCFQRIQAMWANCCENGKVLISGSFSWKPVGWEVRVIDSVFEMLNLEFDGGRPTDPNVDEALAILRAWRASRQFWGDYTGCHHHRKGPTWKRSTVKWNERRNSICRCGGTIFFADINWTDLCPKERLAVEFAYRMLSSAFDGPLPVYEESPFSEAVQIVSRPRPLALATKSR